jgi:uncharacterized protein HemX
MIPPFLLPVIGLAKRIPWQVWAALAVIAAVWLYGQHRDAQGYQRGMERYEASEAAHNVTKASLTALEARLADMVKDGEDREARLAKALKSAGKESASLRSQADRIVREGRGIECRTSDAIMESGV